MWQNLHFRRTQRTIRRRTHMGLLACLLSVLLIGIVIGRTTYRPSGADEVYLDNAPPTHTAGNVRAASEPTPTRIARSSLVPVVRPTVPAMSRPSPSSGANNPSNTVQGSQGGGNASLISPQGGGDFDTGRARLTSIETAVVRLVNAERRTAGCGPLRIDSRLVRSARKHSAEMATSNYFDHSSPNGASPWDRMEAAGYRNGGAENIARGYLTAEDAVRGWMGSRGHKGNILNCRLIATGVGVHAGPGGPWWTQDFGYS
jgi:uncharacterized protein YkwD